MKVKIAEKYYLNSDQYSYWITKQVKTKTGPNAGKLREERASGYYHYIDDLMKGFVEREFRSSDAQSIKELKDVINDLKSLTNEMLTNIKQSPQSSR
ncbi:MAG: hypothetical protein SOR93_10900 [Clostridiales Family XIII bacterium]|nr:hypothetical protein [Clostridia bacterium]MDY3011741.1 hypothetical protein [Clostridiales Family XIII bacterium]